MKIVIYDDKKEKHQSWEARIKEDCSSLHDGYGANKNEALNELKENIDNRIAELKALYPVIENLR